MPGLAEQGPREQQSLTREDAENNGIEIIKLHSEYAVSTWLCLTAVAGSVPSPHWAANSPHSELRSLVMSKVQCERPAL